MSFIHARLLDDNESVAMKLTSDHRRPSGIKTPQGEHSAAEKNDACHNRRHKLMNFHENTVITLRLIHVFSVIIQTVISPSEKKSTSDLVYTANEED